MKKYFSLTMIMVFGWAASIQAQAIEKAEENIEKTAKKVGVKTAEVASKGKAKITDQVYKDKTGPEGETVYIDNHSRYYWVDKRGKRHYAAETELKAKGN